MINFRIISKILGSLLFIEAFFMACCLIMAFSFHEDDELAFMVSTILTFGGAFICLFFGHEAENSLDRRDAYVVVTLTWMVFSFFGMFPFLIHGSLTSITDAYFETMSGFTTTGATVIDDVESLPHGLLFWRSLMQWIGGLGIVFFTVALLPQLVGGSVKVFAAEATGPMRSKMHPRLSTTAKWIWSIYVLLTIACGLSFWLAGMNWFDATNYSMSTTATGGFSTHNGTIFLASPLIEYLAILFQFLAGINFTLLYMSLFKWKMSTLFRNSEFKMYITTIIIATAWIMYLLLTRLDYDEMLGFQIHMTGKNLLSIRHYRYEEEYLLQFYVNKTGPYDLFDWLKHMPDGSGEGEDRFFRNGQEISSEAFYSADSSWFEAGSEVISDYFAENGMSYGFEYSYETAVAVLGGTAGATQAPQPQSGNGEIYGLTIDKLATRKGPGTQYDGGGTYNVKGQQIKLLARAWDGSIWWIKCEIPYKKEIRVLWTGYKRFDHSSFNLEDLPEETW